MASGSRWLRISLDWSSSDWLVVLSAESRLAWIEFLCYVKQVGTYGSVAKRHPLTLARRWGIGEESVSQMLRAAELHGAICVRGQSWEVVKWAEYQGDDAVRAKRYRDSKKTKSDETEPNIQERHVTSRHVTVDTDTDRDKDSNTNPPVTPLDTTLALSHVETEKRIPTLAQWTEYAVSQGMDPIDAESAWHHYESQSWKRNGTPITKWRSCVATCINRNRRRGTPNPNPFDRKDQLMGGAT